MVPFYLLGSPALLKGGVAQPFSSHATHRRLHSIFMAHCRKICYLWLATLELLGSRGVIFWLHSYWSTVLLEALERKPVFARQGSTSQFPDPNLIWLSAMWTPLLELFSTILPKVTLSLNENKMISSAFSFVKSETGNLCLLSLLDSSFFRSPPNWNLVLHRLSRPRETLLG